MKLLKAFVRTSRAEEVVKALEAVKAPGITISREHGVGYGYEPYLFTLAPGELKKAPEITKLEVVCSDGDVARLKDAIVESARTGVAGDGIVFVTAVEDAVKIRNGKEGAAALG